MTDRVQRLAILCSVAAGLCAGAPAWAQTIPEGQSCGGLLCDLGVFGHKTEPAAPAAAVSPLAAAPATTAAAPEAAAPRPRVRKRLVKAPVARKREAKAAPIAAPAPTPRASPASSPAPRQPARAATVAPPPAVATPPAPPPAVATRAPARAYQPPLIFQSIDPMLQ